jgi:hypothetical protein
MQPTAGHVNQRRRKSTLRAEKTVVRMSPSSGSTNGGGVPVFPSVASRGGHPLRIRCHLAPAKTGLLVRPGRRAPKSRNNQRRRQGEGDSETHQGTGGCQTTAHLGPQQTNSENRQRLPLFLTALLDKDKETQTHQGKPHHPQQLNNLQCQKRKSRTAHLLSRPNKTTCRLFPPFPQMTTHSSVSALPCRSRSLWAKAVCLRGCA